MAPSTDSLRVALFKTNYLGDNVVFVPVAQELRRVRPGWRITLITSPNEAPLYEGCIPKDDILTVGPLEMKEAWRRPTYAARWWSELRRRSLDASLVSYDQGSFAHLLARVAGGSVRVGGAGLRIKARGMMTHTTERAQGWSIAKWNWEMGRTLVRALDPSAAWAENPPAPDLGHLTVPVARVPGRVVIHAGSKWLHTRWPLENYVELARRLSTRAEVIWVEVPETSGAALPEGVRSQRCANVRELCQLLASASLFVGNNSGPMHVANAVGTPLVALTGASAPEWNPSWHPASSTVLRTPGLACAPCERVQFSPGFCANTEEPVACLRRLSVGLVESECRGRLDA
jgi:ADP-heptose:LPS heptosyltransferase